MARNSANGAINLCVLGRGAAYLGRFDEAAAALDAAVMMAGSSAPVSVQVKARITLAAVRLTLGDAARARELVETLPADAPPGMQMQAAWILASAAPLEGRRGQPHLDRLADLGVKHPDLPVVLSAWTEWSYQGHAAAVVPRLREVREKFEAMGLAGTARSLQLRETARLLEMDDADACRTAAKYAHVLKPTIDAGLHAGSYPPEGWEILARVLHRAGVMPEARECRRRGCEWILRIALPHVPPADRKGFLEINPVNRRLLGGLE